MAFKSEERDGQGKGRINMDEAEAKKEKWGKLIFWVTLAFCSWIIWYVYTPPMSGH